MTENNITSSPTKVKTSRYQSLIIFIALFVTIIVGVLAINFYISTQFVDDAKEINLAGRQRMLSQSIAKNIHELILAQSAGQDIEKPFNLLQANFTLFDKTLAAFSKGGETTGAIGQTVVLKPVSIEDAIKAITVANKIWSNYKLAIDRLIQSDIAPLQALSTAIAYAETENLNILALMEQLTQSLQQSQYDSIYVNMSGKQRMLTQRITKSLFELINSQSANLNTSEILKSLAEDSHTFNNTLTIFLNGGEVQMDKDTMVLIKPIADQQSIALINKGQELWQPLAKSITKILKEDSNIYAAVATANDFARRENLKLLGLMNDLTVALDQDSSRRSNILRYIQVAGIALAIFMFSIIVLFFLKHLRQADKELDQAKEETDRILETVNDGLFLLDREHIIGVQHSEALVSVINTEQPAGKNFFSILRKIVPENTLQTAKDYLELLYGDRVNAELVADLNPLDKVEVYFGQDGISKNVGYLDFEFKRVIKDGNISHLLVQVLDITDKVKLEKQLAESKVNSQAQLDLMLEVLHVRPRVLGQFLATTESSLTEINSVLQERTKNEGGNRDKLTKIFRYMHRIKGDAASLELHGFEQKAHMFEDILEGLKAQANLSGKDFLPLAISLDEFMSQIESLRSLIAKLGELQGSIQSHDPIQASTSEAIDLDVENMKMPNKLAVLTKSIALKQGKKVILNIFNDQLLPSVYIRPVQDILTQLIRNSIVHGIEKPAIRASFNKTNEGLITVKFLRDMSNSIIIEYTDDGKGLLAQEILATAVNKGLVPAETSSQLSRDKIIPLIFKRGFSTKVASDKDAGRGVGMDIIADLVKGMNGKMGMKSLEHKFFKFVIRLPIAETQETANTSTGE